MEKIRSGMDELLTTKEAAAYPGINRPWFYRKLWRGDFSPSLRVGRFTFYIREYLDRYLRAGKRRGKMEKANIEQEQMDNAAMESGTDKWLSTQEAAEYLQMSLSALYQQVSRGNIYRRKKVGRVSLFIREDLDSFREARQKEREKKKEGTRLFVTGDAEYFLGMDRGELRRLRISGKGPDFYFYNNTYFYSQKDLEAYKMTLGEK